MAALGSPMPGGGSYLAFILRQPNMPTLYQWWQSYCTLMAEVHLTLWLRYGIALESNQQNAMLSLAPGQPLTLVLKDNDAARLWPARFCAACPDLAPRLVQLRDPRICVDDERALAQMFITITLQLDLAAVLESRPPPASLTAPRPTTYCARRWRTPSPPWRSAASIPPSPGAACSRIPISR
ncbi:ferric iron reductase [Edwardsiella anguillarum]|nr:ferric iron reductase [Edwardsiella anguillarum]